MTNNASQPRRPGAMDAVRRPVLHGPAPVMAPRPFTQIQVVKKACKCGKLSRG